MGMTTFIYGAIREYDLRSPSNNTLKRNELALSELPVNDSWPPLSQEMFSITKNKFIDSGPNLEYDGRMIHFAASLKSVEHEWLAWKVKFEDLLVKLFWIEANVHFKTEYSELVTFEWHVDLLRWKNNDPLKPPGRNTWQYKDARNWEASF